MRNASVRFAQALGIAVVFGLGLGFSGGRASALQSATPLPVCGVQPADGSPAPHAGLTIVPATVETDLGNTNGGSRNVTFDVSVDDTCALPSGQVPVSFETFAGPYHDLDNKAAFADSATVDGGLIRVVVTVNRSAVHSGKYVGLVRVGDGTIGSTTAQLTVTRQSPLLWVPLLLGLLGMLGGVVLAGLRHLNPDHAGEALVANKARTVSLTKGQVSPPQALLGVLWRGFLGLVVAPLEAALRFAWAALRHVFLNKNIWPVLVGIGAAITAFVAAYAKDDSWTPTITSVVGLVSAVGGAAFTAAYAAWQPAGGK